VQFLLLRCPFRERYCRKTRLKLSKETSNCATKISEDDVLRACCEDIMVNFAEKDFEYDSLAITKNFVASPHVDKDDMSYQFALSLGDFDSGGELMVENRLGTKRYRVNTKNRIAKCDGRSCHWVRGYSGDRYRGFFESQKVTKSHTKLVRIRYDNELESVKTIPLQSREQRWILSAIICSH
jgi:hypothetical protein